MPVSALTISASAQNVTPSPYGRDRPCRHRMSSASCSTTRNSSCTSRLLPMPGTPTTVTSCGERSSFARASVEHQQVELADPADQGHRRLLGDVDAEPGPRRHGLPRRDRFALSLREHGSRRPVVDRLCGGAMGLLADEHAVQGRRRLQPRGGVHHVAGGHRLAPGRPGVEVDQGLAGVDADAQLEPFVVAVRPGADLQRCPDRSLRVVLVCDRRAEDRHHGITDELLHRPAVPRELVAQVGVVRRQQRAHVLRVELLGAGGETHQVGEEHGDDLPLLARGAGRVRRGRGAAEGAERELSRQLLAAAGAGHAAECGTAALVPGWTMAGRPRGRRGCRPAVARRPPASPRSRTAPPRPSPRRCARARSPRGARRSAHPAG